MPPTTIAVLGSGITGLSAAFHLSRRFPHAAITVIDKNPNSGGWVRSKRHKLPKGGSVLLEAGPRSLRPNALSLLELINLLRLEDTLIATPKSSPAAKSRFIHVPGTRGLARIPTSVLSFLSSPLSSVILPAALREPFLFKNRPEADRGLDADESFHSFFSRRFGEKFARILGSALVHGIYAADSRQLSIRAAFPSLYQLEDAGKGSVGRGVLLSSLAPRPARDTADYELGGTLDLMKDVSVYSFRDGLSTLCDALQRNVQANPNITILQGTGVESIELGTTPHDGFNIALTSGEVTAPSHVVSTLPLPVLQRILQQPGTNAPALPHLNANTYTSVNVFNLVFPKSPSTRIHPEGFGYLVSRPAAGYDDESRNPAGILGTVFDSCAVAEQDESPSDSSEQYTKMTVMQGGPYTNRPQPTVDTIVSALAGHLTSPRSSTKARLPDPVAYEVHENKDCIPLYTPGHVTRMQELKDALRSGPWGGRLEVIGAGVGGVSLGDCAESGKRAGASW